MENVKSFFAHKFLKIVLWVFLILVGLFIILLIWRIFDRQKTEETDLQVMKIHSTKLSIEDVLGKNLPPDPGTEADKTVAGIDANQNGIRDDVELAVFKAYPNSAKTRAVLLQYALALQMQMTLPIVNEKTVTATVEDNESRALNCIWSISSRSDMEKFTKETDANENFIKSRQFNIDMRKKARDYFYKYLRSYSVSHESCDLDLNKLPN